MLSWSVSELCVGIIETIRLTQDSLNDELMSFFSDSKTGFFFFFTFFLTHSLTFRVNDDDGDNGGNCAGGEDDSNDDNDNLTGIIIFDSVCFFFSFDLCLVFRMGRAPDRDDAGPDGFRSSSTPHEGILSPPPPPSIPHKLGHGSRGGHGDTREIAG